MADGDERILEPGATVAVASLVTTVIANLGDEDGACLIDCDSGYSYDPVTIPADAWATIETGPAQITNIGATPLQIGGRSALLRKQQERARDNGTQAPESSAGDDKVVPVGSAVGADGPDDEDAIAEPDATAPSRPLPPPGGD